jgi:hypothetical protein
MVDHVTYSETWRKILDRLGDLTMRSIDYSSRCKILIKILLPSPETRASALSGFLGSIGMYIT